MHYTTKICPKGHNKDVEGRTKDGRCKPCARFFAARWSKNNPLRVLENKRRTNTKRLYGITYEDKLKLIAEQNNLCAGCYCQFIENNPACLDHDHKTGKIRAVLCRTDNAILGLVGDDSTRLRRLADYLEKHKENK